MFSVERSHNSYFFLLSISIFSTYKIKKNFQTQIIREERQRDDSVYLCGHPGVDDFFKGYIAAIDIYTAIQPKSPVSDALRTLVMADHTRRVFV